jgi:hypothetical protein
MFGQARLIRKPLIGRTLGTREDLAQKGRRSAPSGRARVRDGDYRVAYHALNQDLTYQGSISRSWSTQPG